MEDWESLGADVGSRPAVATWAEDAMQVFFIGTDGQLWDTYWDGVAWHERHSHGGDLVGSPAACSWGADRIDLFVQSDAGELLHGWWDGGRWSFAPSQS